MIALKHGITARQFDNKENWGFEITEERKELWAVLLDILLETDRICKKHGIKYFLFAGSMLGAARHGGFIPWDDDLDIAMLRPDYDKFCSIAAKEFTGDYFFQHISTDPYSVFNAHARVMNIRTTAVIPSRMRDGLIREGGCHGVFMDVFPVDGMPADEKERLAYLRQLHSALRKRKRLLKARSIYVLRQGTGVLSLHNFILGWWLQLEKRFFGIDRVARADRAVTELVTRYTYPNGASYSDLAAFPKTAVRRNIDRTLFDGFTTLPFEGHEFPVPAKWEGHLDRKFGDWRTPVRGASCHGELFVDVNKPYTDYLPKKK